MLPRCRPRLQAQACNRGTTSEPRVGRPTSTGIGLLARVSRRYPCTVTMGYCPGQEPPSLRIFTYYRSSHSPRATGITLLFHAATRQPKKGAGNTSGNGEGIMYNCREKKEVKKDVKKGWVEKGFLVHRRKCVVNKERKVGLDVRIRRKKKKRGLQIR